MINRFAGGGILVAAGGAASVIAGNYVGTNTLGTAALGNNRGGVGFDAGIGLFVGGVTIGGTAPADRNLVSGQNLNFSRGIELCDSSGNTIQGNYVGTNAAGTAALGNAGAGIALDGTLASAPTTTSSAAPLPVPATSSPAAGPRASPSRSIRTATRSRGTSSV